MSCIMSSPELLSALAESIEFIGNGNYEAIGFELPRSLAMALSDCRDRYGSIDGNKVYKKLYAMNIAAYNGRWKEQIDVEEDPVRPKGKRLLPTYAEHTGVHFVVDPLHYTLARTLDFYVYQCEEDATYTAALLQGMNELAVTVARFIVRNSEEYASGQWGAVDSPHLPASDVDKKAPTETVSPGTSREAVK